MATIEQYGEGPYVVRIATDDLVGTYRFGTEAEARAFRRKNGGKVYRSNRPAPPLVDLGYDAGQAGRTS